VLFREDALTRPGGGGEISRVLQSGRPRVFEKATVNVFVVYGVMLPEVYHAARLKAVAAAAAGKARSVPFHHCWCQLGEQDSSLCSSIFTNSWFVQYLRTFASFGSSRELIV
jgi:hypothetical protein